jgi:asparagine synthase (glutamine-hydrolysing)
MCGIAGFYGFSDKKLIKQFSKELEHRGPDGEGFYIDENVSLLNRRLAIIDVAGGDQPIYNEDKSIVIVYNGELYNYQELREDLKNKGHVFATESDTEVIVHSYEEYGEKCFATFNGMFALALYDIKKRKLLLARDQFGIKPLYFYLRDNKLVFSSEIKPLLHSGHIENKVNNRILHRYIKYRIHDDGEETFFEGIYRLLPGQLLTIDKNETKKTIYFKELVEDNKPLNRTQTIHVFKSKLIEAVKLRLISEVPVGTSFSGGLDSSTVVTIVNKLLKDNVKESRSIGKLQKTFSAIFPGSTNDEEKYIDSVIEKVGKENLSVFKIKPTADGFIKDIKDFVRTQEEPTISTGPYAQYCVMRVAHKQVTVLLDGQGSDEMMAGYLPYYFVYLRQLKNSGNILLLAKEIFTSRDVLTKYVLLKFKRNTSINSQQVLHPAFASKFKEPFITNQIDLKKRLYEDVFKNSLQSLLRYEDKNTMRFSMEGRVPFLDINLLSFINSLSPAFIIRNGWNKYILRQAMKGMLPDEIINRRNKIGFTTPEYEWFLEKKDFIRSIFESESFSKREYFNHKAVLRLWGEFEQKKNTDTMLFWRIMNVELWLREFIDPPDMS